MDFSKINEWLMLEIRLDFVLLLSMYNIWHILFVRLGFIGIESGFGISRA